MCPQQHLTVVEALKIIKGDKPIIDCCKYTYLLKVTTIAIISTVSNGKSTASNDNCEQRQRHHHHHWHCHDQ
jgi:hypothetical protein